MTVIACDGRSMAADSRMTNNANRIISETTPKLARTKAGWIVGAAGRGEGARLVAEALDADAKPAFISTSAIVLLPDGTGRFYEEDGEFSACSWPFAIGSGRDFALAAMDLCHSPAAAVEAAIRRDPFSGGKVQEMSLSLPTPYIGESLVTDGGGC